MSGYVTLPAKWTAETAAELPSKTPKPKPAKKAKA